MGFKYLQWIYEGLTGIYRIDNNRGKYKILNEKIKEYNKGDFRIKNKNNGVSVYCNTKSEDTDE